SVNVTDRARVVVGKNVDTTSFSKTERTLPSIGEISVESSACQVTNNDNDDISSNIDTNNNVNNELTVKPVSKETTICRICEDEIYLMYLDRHSMACKFHQ